jgi:hypothetical protein
MLRTQLVYQSLNLRPGEAEFLADPSDCPTCPGQLHYLLQYGVPQDVEGPFVATLDDLELGLERQHIIPMYSASFGEVDLEPSAILRLIVL